MDTIANEAAQLKIARERVRRDGGVDVCCEQLTLLCAANRSSGQHFLDIAEFARREGWSFRFLDGGCVHFASYESVTNAAV